VLSVTQQQGVAARTAPCCCGCCLHRSHCSLCRRPPSPQPPGHCLAPSLPSVAAVTCAASSAGRGRLRRAIAASASAAATAVAWATALPLPPSPCRCVAAVVAATSAAATSPLSPSPRPLLPLPRFGHYRRRRPKIGRT
jgi:hypothetical protein